MDIGDNIEYHSHKTVQEVLKRSQTSTGAEGFSFKKIFFNEIAVPCAEENIKCLITSIMKLRYLRCVRLHMASMFNSMLYMRKWDDT